MAVKQKILIVEDDERTAKELSSLLTRENYLTRSVSDGEQALSELPLFQPDLILLDLILPGMDGFQVCREIRHTSQVPVIILSARTDSFDKVLGLELGADDYVCKPYDARELVARIHAVLRRYHIGSSGVTAGEKSVHYQDLTVNLTNYSVTYFDEQVVLPPKELELFYFLASSPNQVFSREQLLDHIWGYEYMGDTRTVDVHIKRLREKFKDHPQWKIATVWGIGYKFEVKN
ncbi:MAG: response regulator transcription factor [Blautia sp.]|nr:response regulator transcription factor [Blautia sp.]